MVEGVGEGLTLGGGKAWQREKGGLAEGVEERLGRGVEETGREGMGEAWRAGGEAWQSGWGRLSRGGGVKA